MCIFTLHRDHRLILHSYILFVLLICVFWDPFVLDGMNMILDCLRNCIRACRASNDDSSFLVHLE